LGPIVSLLADLFPDSVTYELPTFDGMGKETDTSTSTIRAQVAGITKRVRLEDGQIVTSNVQAILAGAPGITVNHVVTLPARFTPRKPKILSVEQHTDEGGAHHETLYFA